MLVDKCVAALYSAFKTHGTNLERVEFHVTPEAGLHLNNECFQGATCFITYRADKPHPYMTVHGYDVVLKEGSGCKIDLHIQVCRNLPVRVICVC